MDFVDRIHELAARIPKQLPHIQTEEATKNALVMPFISALGYNVFDPTEVTPELSADFGVKKGEKVDYAILRDGQPIMLFECKWHGIDLDKTHASQLYRYFSVTHARFGVLTNGLVYRFYTDLEAANKMDAKPFFEFDLRSFKDRHIEQLKKFTKSAFNVDDITATASDLKYTRAIKNIIAADMQEPSDGFVRYLAGQVYSGRLTQAVREQFSSIVKRALQQYINDRISQRLEYALADEQAQQPSAGEPAGETPVADTEPDAPPDVVTTKEELAGYYIVKAILRGVVDAHRITMRDVKSYCGLLLDGNGRQTICRLHFNREQKYLGLFDTDKKDERLPIDDVDDIFQYADRIIATVKSYQGSWSAARPAPAKAAPAKAGPRPSSTSDFTGSQLTAVVFDGRRLPVSSWKEGLLAILELMRQQNPRQFESAALTLTGRVRPYVTRKPEELRSSQLIPGTNLYVETNLSASSIAAISRRLVEEMGHDPGKLSFETA